MALNRVEGDEELYVGGIWALKRPSALQERGITHVLSVLRCNPSEDWSNKYRHMTIDVDDVEDEDLLYHLPRAVRFIHSALHPSGSGMSEEAEKQRIQIREKAAGRPDAITEAPPNIGDLTLAEPDTPSTPGAVFVHCAMGKSRSVAVVAAYLLYKHPSRFGRASHSNAEQARALPGSKSDGASTATRAAVAAAIAHVRRTREIAEPNDGFVRQLELWWDMGCPVAEGALEAHTAYQRWQYRREVEESLAVGEAPTRLRFEDEERATFNSTSTGSANTSPLTGDAGLNGSGRNKELRCKKCRRVLASSPFVVDHRPASSSSHSHSRTGRGRGRGAEDDSAVCQHFFIEPLSWMRPALETAEVEGRLACPNDRCGASLGRFSWKGFRCSCGEWIIPAFSLARGRVDEVTALPDSGGSVDAGPRGDTAAARAAFGIRMPPGSGRL